MDKTRKIILVLSLFQAALIILSAAGGLLVPGLYSRESAAWQVQTLGQDFIDAFLAVPVLLPASFYIASKNKKAIHIWGGVNLYLVYTYTIFCFDVHFNRFFIIYCFILGSSFYAMLIFVYRLLKNNYKNPVSPSLTFRVTGFYFIVTAVLFYVLWLSQLIPAIIHNKIPAIVSGTNLPTSPVHVIDLAILLPGLFLTGIFILKGRQVAYFLAPALLTFIALMDVTIAFLTWFGRNKGTSADMVLIVVMMTLAMFNLVLLGVFFRQIKKQPWIG